MIYEDKKNNKWFYNKKNTQSNTAPYNKDSGVGFQTKNTDKTSVLSENAQVQRTVRGELKKNDTTELGKSRLDASEMGEFENNYLYVSQNPQGLLKVGVSRNNPFERVESMNKDYVGQEFEVLTYFHLKRYDRYDVERFSHELLNAQFLNLKYLVQNGFVQDKNLQSIVTQRKQGHTELFVGGHAIVANVVIFLHLIDAIDAKMGDLKALSLKTLTDASHMAGVDWPRVRAEMGKSSVIKPKFGNRAFVMKKNFNSFFNSIEKTKVKFCKFKSLNDDLVLSFAQKQIKASNFLYSHFSDKEAQELLKVKFYKTSEFVNLSVLSANLRQQNTQRKLSTQWDDGLSVTQRKQKYASKFRPSTK